MMVVNVACVEKKNIYPVHVNTSNLIIKFLSLAYNLTWLCMSQKEWKMIVYINIITFSYMYIQQIYLSYNITVMLAIGTKCFDNISTVQNLGALVTQVIKTVLYTVKELRGWPKDWCQIKVEIQIVRGGGYKTPVRFNLYTIIFINNIYHIYYLGLKKKYRCMNS